MAEGTKTQPFVLIFVKSCTRVATLGDLSVTVPEDNDVYPSRIQCPSCQSFDCNAEILSDYHDTYHCVTSNCGEYFMDLEFHGLGELQLDELVEYEDVNMRVDLATEVQESYGGRVDRLEHCERAFKVQLLEICGVVPYKVFYNFEDDDQMTADQVLECVFGDAENPSQLQDAKLHARKLGFYESHDSTPFVLPITPTYNLWEHEWPGNPTEHESYIEVLFTNDTSMSVWGD